MSSLPRLIAKTDQHTLVFTITVLVLIFTFGLFVVGFDQGHLFSIAFGEQAFEDLYIHELTHDMRHAAGFPCH
ncbi:MAG: CbtB-domain containing protein [Nitrosopumilus sp.]|nr:MAG: CbtB-domain containing protein [Nitrosopumilus sp.]